MKPPGRQVGGSVNLHGGAAFERLRQSHLFRIMAVAIMRKKRPLFGGVTDAAALETYDPWFSVCPGHSFLLAHRPHPGSAGSVPGMAQAVALPPLKDGGPIEAAIAAALAAVSGSLPPLKDGGPIEAAASSRSSGTGLRPFLR